MAVTDADTGAARVFLYDARMVLGLANYARYVALNRVFGVSRSQANLLTGVFVLGAAEATFATARKLLRSPLTADDAALGALALREAAIALGGPSSRRISGFGALVGLALIGGVAVPSLRQAVHSVREAEQHMRERRMRAFAAMRRVTTLS